MTPGIRWWLWTLLIVALIVGFVVLAVLGYDSPWTGFGAIRYSNGQTEVYIPPKTFWDWLGLLIIPLTIALSALGFSALERRYEQLIAHARIRDERQIAEERSQDAALEAYLAQMSTLIVDKGLGYKPDDDQVRIIARTWTLTVLRRLSGERRGIIARFLYESNLISAERDASGTSTLEVVKLEDAFFAEVMLDEAILKKVNFKGADLRYGHFSHAVLAEASFAYAMLALADFQWANLQDTDLREANFEMADLRGADLGRAMVDAANFKDALYTEHTVWPEGFDPVAAGAILLIG